MKKWKRSHVCLLAVIVLLAAAALLLWSSRPQTLETMLDMETETFTGMAAICVIGDIRNGKPIHDVYTLSPLMPEDTSFTALLAALESSRYCASPSNLIPYPHSSAGGNGGSVSISLTLAAGDKYASFTFLTPRKLSLALPGKDTLLIYFLTDDTAFSAMQRHLMENGTTK